MAARGRGIAPDPTSRATPACWDRRRSRSLRLRARCPGWLGAGARPTPGPCRPRCSSWRAPPRTPRLPRLRDSPSSPAPPTLVANTSTRRHPTEAMADAMATVAAARPSVWLGAVAVGAIVQLAAAFCAQALRRRPGPRWLSSPFWRALGPHARPSQPGPSVFKCSTRMAPPRRRSGRRGSGPPASAVRPAPGEPEGGNPPANAICSAKHRQKNGCFTKHPGSAPSAPPSDSRSPPSAVRLPNPLQRRIALGKRAFEVPGFFGQAQTDTL